MKKGFFIIFTNPRLTRLSILSAMLSVCACGNVSYVANHSMKENYLARPFEEDAMKAPQKFGALRLTTPARSDDPDARPSERIFLLKRDGKSYMAETVLADFTGEDHKGFDKAFFSFGTDREDRSVGFRLRLVY